ncbi:hypothetical protein [Spiroplasma sp. hyd1]|uniref:hypothetical protein n=1 Tax=Spiroplasma sp. hyd1 TaxID=1609976 RepID=UPI0018DC2469|nr:hypothetical protein [Spiroplasma sp. hyd1]MBH8622700.1 hypothetical protein [Spiroplasma sp. hyd1]
MGLGRALGFGINEKGYKKQLEKENAYFRTHLETIELRGYKARVLNWVNEEEVKYVWSCYPEIKDGRTGQNFYEYFNIEKTNQNSNEYNMQKESFNKGK